MKHNLPKTYIHNFSELLKFHKRVKLPYSEEQKIIPTF